MFIRLNAWLLIAMLPVMGVADDASVSEYGGVVYPSTSSVIQLHHEKVVFDIHMEPHRIFAQVHTALVFRNDSDRDVTLRVGFPLAGPTLENEEESAVEVTRLDGF